MEDETLGFFKKTSSSHARLNVPALVQVAALAIIMIRGLDVLMIFNTLGVRGIGEFIHRSVQTWSLTLVFLSSLVLVFIEIWCAFSLVKGRRWARWLYLLTQITAASYLWAASLGYAHPDAAVRSLDQSAVLPVAIMCIIVAPDDVKVNVCSAHFTTRVAVVPVSG